MYRFFEDETRLRDGKIYIFDENYRHIVRVLRIDAKEEFEVVLGETIYLVQIDEEREDHIVCKILAEKKGENESPLRLRIYQGLPKSDKLELIIQKTIELGVVSITPFKSKRTVVKWDEKKEKKKIKRYEEIAKAASKQAKRDYIPEIKPLMDFKDLVEVVDQGATILAYEIEGRPMKEVLKEVEELGQKDVNVIIGPEGGFAPEEVELLRAKGAHVVNLGNRILRTETAAISLASIIQYELGDL